MMGNKGALLHLPLKRDIMTQAKLLKGFGCHQ